MQRQTTNDNADGADGQVTGLLLLYRKPLENLVRILAVIIIGAAGHCLFIVIKRVTDLRGNALPAKQQLRAAPAPEGFTPG